MVRSVKFSLVIIGYWFLAIWFLVVFYQYSRIAHGSLQTSAQPDKASSVEIGGYLRKYPPNFRDVVVDFDFWHIVLL